jgi:hypothetical protein
MKRTMLLAALLTLAVCLAPAAADEPAAAPASKAADLLPAFDVYFQTFVYAANDRDFDRTKPLYNANGQSVGYVLTTLRPGLTWKPADILTLRYQMEAGDNVWSRNDVYGDDMASEATPVFRQKEIWAQATTPCKCFGGQVGFMHVLDTTQLILDRHIGMLRLFGGAGDNGVNVIAGQIPDEVYEGFGEATDDANLNDNNFEHDDYIFGLYSHHQVGARDLAPGLYFRWDKTDVSRPKGVLNVVFDATARPGGVLREAWFDVVGQYGQHLRAGLDDRDVEILAAAAQGGMDLEWRLFGLRYNALIFTADDGDKNDRTNTAFDDYSGTSKSHAMILAKNWIHDRYDNLDEGVARQGAGLALIDAEFAYKPVDSVRIFLIGATADVLDTTNTDGESWLGVEGQLGVEFQPIRDHLWLHLIAGGLAPGKATGQLFNLIDREKTDPLFAGQAAVTVSY